MRTETCSSIRELFLAGLAEHTTVQKIRDTCVVSLAIPTVDGRFVDVFIEPRNADFFLVHDGGKAFNELILQGTDVTDSTERRFTMVAGAYGVNWSDEMFQGLCKIDRLYGMATSVAMCSSIAVADLAGHFQSVEDEPVRDQAEAALRAWAKKQSKISRDERVAGTLKQHLFDFVARTKGYMPVSISILSPGNSSLGAAERFGFKVQDISDAKTKQWPKVVVEAKSEAWSTQARKIIEKCSDYIIPVRSDGALSRPMMAEAMHQVLRKAS